MLHQEQIVPGTLSRGIKEEKADTQIHVQKSWGQLGSV